MANAQLLRTTRELEASREENLEQRNILNRGMEAITQTYSDIAQHSEAESPLAQWFMERLRAICGELTPGTSSDPDRLQGDDTTDV
jgi:hypothetical protein